MNLGSTTMGFNYTTGDSGRSIDLYSTHVPTSFADSIRIGAATGIDTASITTPSLMMHMAASSAILQLTDRQGKMNAREVLDKTYKAYKVLRGVRSATTTGASSTTSGRITATEALIKGFKETYGLDEEEKNSDAKSSSSSATTGGPMGEDPNDPKKKDKKEENDVKYPDNPKENPASFRPLESSGAKKNLTDGSVWEKDTSSHGGEQWKRWDTQRSWEKGEKPTSVWPDGRVRK
ncbi:MAG: hypothetical protein KBD04_06465 [Proteobacteria bacterium]|nr:hypothetical protein [Pseudomonadota bacterium]